MHGIFSQSIKYAPVQQVRTAPIIGSKMPVTQEAQSILIGVDSQSDQSLEVAEKLLEMERSYLIACNNTNYPIRKAIKLVLTSTECRPALKVKIFENMMRTENQLDQDQSRLSAFNRIEYSKYTEFINDLLNQIREDGRQINLDNTNFTGVHLKFLDLSGCSAKSARFASNDMQGVSWIGCDLTNAHFESSVIQGCEFGDVTLNGARFRNCKIIGGAWNDVDLSNVHYDQTTFNEVFSLLIKTNDMELMRKIRSSPVIKFDGVNIAKRYVKSCEKGLAANKLIFEHSSEPSPGDICMLAARPLTTKFLTVTNCPENQRIKSAIKTVLSMPGYGPKVKRKIFENIMLSNQQLDTIHVPSFSQSEDRTSDLQSYTGCINTLLADIRAGRGRINLNNVDFYRIRLSGLNLTGASAVNAKFTDTVMQSAIWTGGNFSKAQFSNTTIRNSTFRDSLFDKSLFCRAYIERSDFTHVTMKAVKFQRTKFEIVTMNKLVTDDANLMQLVNRYRTNIRALIPDKAELIRDRTLRDLRQLFRCAILEKTQILYLLACEYSTSASRQSRQSGVHLDMMRYEQCMKNQLGKARQ